MIEDLIYGIIYSEISDEVGPNPKIWIPTDMNEEQRMLITVKSVSLLTGEVEIPKKIIMIPFTSFNLKGIVKYIEWNDEARRGGVARSIITLLFRDFDDLIFYKYMTDLEVVFNEIAEKLQDIEPLEASKIILTEEITDFQAKIVTTLKELSAAELSSQELERFPEEKEDEVDYRFKIVVCGDPGVGKTSLILRFTNNAFKRTYMPTIGVNITNKNIVVNGMIVQLVFWDVAGQAQFKKIRTHFYAGSEGLILLFDLTNFNTFNNCYNWYNDIKDKLGKDKALHGFLIGNKNDLVDDKQIKREAAENLAGDINLGYVETSALTGANVEHVFYQIANKLLNKYLDE